MSVDSLALRQETLIARVDQKTLARLGVLIGLKLNMFRNGERLKWGYMDDVELRRRGLTNDKIAALRGELQKAEKIYLELGGDVRHFKQAILNGAGNQYQFVPNYGETLSGVVPISPEKSILEASVPDLFASVMKGGLGEVSTNQNSSSLNAGTSWLKRISVIAGNISSITDSLDTTAKQTTTGVSTMEANMPNAQASTGSNQLAQWYQDNKKTALGVAGLLATAGLFITGMKHEDKPKPKSRKKSGSSARKSGPSSTSNKRKKTARSASEKFKVVPLQ